MSSRHDHNEACAFCHQTEWKVCTAQPAFAACRMCADGPVVGAHQGIGTDTGEGGRHGDRTVERRFWLCPRGLAAGDRSDIFRKRRVVVQPHCSVGLRWRRDAPADRGLDDLGRAADLPAALLREAGGGSPSNVTRCMGLLCRINTGAIGTGPDVVRIDRSMARRPSTVGEPDTTSFSCSRVSPLESMYRMRTSPSPAIAISIPSSCLGRRSIRPPVPRRGRHASRRGGPTRT